MLQKQKSVEDAKTAPKQLTDDPNLKAVLAEVEVDVIGKIMLKAADHLEKHGHVKGILFSGECVCIRGALLAGQGPERGRYFTNHSKEKQDNVYAAERRMGFDPTGVGGVYWNNASERRPQEVIDRLRQYAKGDK